MGGYGSGRRCSRYRLVEHCAAIDSSSLMRRREVPPGTRAVAIADGQEIALAATPCRYGGRRWWFVCGCGARRRKLYRPGPSWPFACRSCYDLRYRSQRVSLPDRWRARADQIIERLGERDDSGYVHKPPGMHWTTFDRLMDESEYYYKAAFGYRFVRSGLPGWMRD